MKPYGPRVRDLLRYNHITHQFHWRKKPFGIRGLDNPKNIAGSVDQISKKAIIRIDQHIFPIEDLLKFFIIPLKKKVIKTINGVTWTISKRAYRVRVYSKNKTIHLGYNRNFQEAVFMKLAGEQCLGVKINKKVFAYCKNLVGWIK